MEDRQVYSITLSHGLVILNVSWRGENAELLHNASFAFVVRELAHMTRPDAHVMIRETARKYGVESIPPNVEEALLVLALGEPPLSGV